MVQRMRIAVIGVGGIGGVVAASLQRAGRHDVLVCARRPITDMTFEESDATTQIPIRSAIDPEEAAPVDWVLLCTKAHDTPSTRPWLARLCRAGTRVAVLQNGIDQETRVAPLVGEATVFPVIVHFNGERIAPGRIR